MGACYACYLCGKDFQDFQQGIKISWQSSFVVAVFEFCLSCSETPQLRRLRAKIRELPSLQQVVGM